MRGRHVSRTHPADKKIASAVTRIMVSQNRPRKLCRAKRAFRQGETVVREGSFPTLNAPVHVTGIEYGDITGHKRMCLAIALERPHATTNKADGIVAMGMRCKRL